MSLQGTLKFGHGFDEPLYFGQNRFLTPIQIDITNQRPRCKQRGIKFAALQAAGYLTLAAVAKYPCKHGYLARCSRE